MKRTKCMCTEKSNIVNVRNDLKNISKRMKIHIQVTQIHLKDSISFLGARISRQNIKIFTEKIIHQLIKSGKIEKPDKIGIVNW